MIIQLRETQPLQHQNSFYDSQNRYRMLVRKDVGYVASARRESTPLTENAPFNPSDLLVSSEGVVMSQGDFFRFLTFVPPPRVRSQLVMGGLVRQPDSSDVSDPSANQEDEASNFPRSRQPRLMSFIFQSPAGTGGEGHFDFADDISRGGFRAPSRESPRRRRVHQHRDDPLNSGDGWLVRQRVSFTSARNLQSPNHFGDDLVQHIRHRSEHGGAARERRRSDYFEVQFRVLKARPASLFSIQGGMLTRVFEHEQEFFQISVPYLGLEPEVLNGESVPPQVIDVDQPDIDFHTVLTVDERLEQFLIEQERRADMGFISTQPNNQLMRRSPPVTVVGGGQCSVVFTFPGRTNGLVFRRYAGLSQEEADRLIYTEQASSCFLEEIARARNRVTRGLRSPEDITLPAPGSPENTRLPSSYFRIPSPDGLMSVYEVQRHLAPQELVQTHIQTFLDVGPIGAMGTFTSVRVMDENNHEYYDNLLLYSVVDLLFGELLDHISLVGDNLDDLRAMQGLPVGVGDDTKIDNLAFLLKKEGGGLQSLA